MGALSEIPNLNVDGFLHIAKFLRVPEFVRLSSTCWDFKRCAGRNEIWRYFSLRFGVPLVATNEPRNLYSDFKILYPITLRSEILEQFLGRVIDPIPPISQEVFNRLTMLDPFEDKIVDEQLPVQLPPQPRSRCRNIFSRIMTATNSLGADASAPLQAKVRPKQIRDRFCVIINPSRVEIEVGPERPLRLSPSGDLEENVGVEVERNTLIVRLSFINLRLLCIYQRGHMNDSVFRLDDNVLQEHNFHNPVSDKVELYCMGRHVEKWRGLDFEVQEALIEANGYTVTPSRVALLSFAVSILSRRTLTIPCSLTMSPRPQDLCKIISTQRRPGLAMAANFDVKTGEPILGAIVPGISAEVQQEVQEVEQLVQQVENMALRDG